MSVPTPATTGYPALDNDPERIARWHRAVSVRRALPATAELTRLKWPLREPEYTWNYRSSGARIIEVRGGRVVEAE